MIFSNLFTKKEEKNKPVIVFGRFEIFFDTLDDYSNWLTMINKLTNCEDGYGIREEHMQRTCDGKIWVMYSKYDSGYNSGGGVL